VVQHLITSSTEEARENKQVVMTHFTEQYMGKTGMFAKKLVQSHAGGLCA
jgi:hypothetical protein